jgi:hypothetical protein
LILSMLSIASVIGLRVAYGQQDTNPNPNIRNAVPQSFSTISRQFDNIVIEKTDIAHNDTFMKASFPQQMQNPQIRNIVAESFSNISRSLGNNTTP